MITNEVEENLGKSHKGMIETQIGAIIEDRFNCERNRDGHEVSGALPTVRNGTEPACGWHPSERV